MSHDAWVAICRADPAVAKLKLEPSNCLKYMGQETDEVTKFCVDLSIHAALLLVRCLQETC